VYTTVTYLDEETRPKKKTMKGHKTVLFVRVHVTTCYYYVNLGLIKRGYFWSSYLTLAAKRKSCNIESVTICLEAFAAAEFNEIWFY
jgi:hypothetical protein